MPESARLPNAGEKRWVWMSRMGVTARACSTAAAMFTGGSQVIVIHGAVVRLIRPRLADCLVYGNAVVFQPGVTLDFFITFSKTYAKIGGHAPAKEHGPEG